MNDGNCAPATPSDDLCSIKSEANLEKGPRCRRAQSRNHCPRNQPLGPTVESQTWGGPGSYVRLFGVPADIGRHRVAPVGKRWPWVSSQVAETYEGWPLVSLVSAWSLLGLLVCVGCSLVGYVCRHRVAPCRMLGWPRVGCPVSSMPFVGRGSQ